MLALFKLKRKFAAAKVIKDPLNVLLRKNPTPKIIFDVGAHLGETTMALQSHFPKASIYLFEPYPPSFEKISSTFKGQSQVKPYPIALSDVSGNKKFYVNTTAQTNSLLAKEKSSSTYVPLSVFDTLNEVTVNSTTLDLFCRDLAIDEIDVLKIDVQGNDLKVLKGGEKLLNQSKVRAVLVEVIFVPLYVGQAPFHEIDSFLSNFSFELFDLFNEARNEEGKLLWADALYFLK